MGTAIVAALTSEYVIGCGGKLPWRISEEAQLFKQITSGGTVIMGKNTWESLPAKFRPLPNRTNIVVSSTLAEAGGATICKTLNEAIWRAKKGGKEIFIIGGARLYEESIKYCDTMHLSWVKKNYSGDTYFPKFNAEEWEVGEEREYAEFIYKKYLRKQTEAKK